MRYRQLNHTADIMVEIYGRTAVELFVNAAFCVADVMYRPDLVDEKEHVCISLDAADLPELFLDWLRELLYLFAVRRLALHRATVEQLTDHHLEASVRGERFDPRRHGMKVELKTPTYHGYRLEQLPDGFRATVIFDA
ncbi:MAG: archease [candidate division WOR-3 bacterium]